VPKRPGSCNVHCVHCDRPETHYNQRSTIFLGFFLCLFCFSPQRSTVKDKNICWICAREVGLAEASLVCLWQCYPIVACICNTQYAVFFRFTPARTPYWVTLVPGELQRYGHTFRGRISSRFHCAACCSNPMHLVCLLLTHAAVITALTLPASSDCIKLRMQILLHDSFAVAPHKSVSPLC